jgi:hypothetical protein
MNGPVDVILLIAALAIAFPQWRSHPPSLTPPAWPWSDPRGSHAATESRQPAPR